LSCNEQTKSPSVTPAFKPEMEVSTYKANVCTCEVALKGPSYRPTQSEIGCLGGNIVNHDSGPV